MLFSDCHMADEMNIKTSSCSAVKKPNIQADFPFGYQSLSSLTFRKWLCDKGSLLILASWSFFSNWMVNTSDNKLETVVLFSNSSMKIHHNNLSLLIFLGGLLSIGTVGDEMAQFLSGFVAESIKGG